MGRVLVVGAGPGGLQAAIAAAQFGHDVTVLERQAQPGGQVRLAATVPNRAEFGDMIRNQVAEALRLGVTVRYGVTADAAVVARHSPDRVVVATGAVTTRPWWVSGGAQNVADVRDVMAGSATPTGSVVLVDEVGFHHATSVAELLADRGCPVEVVTSGMVVGQDLGLTLDMEGWWVRANAKAIAQSTDLVPMAFDGNTLTLLHHPTGVNEVRRPDWVILAAPGAPDDRLYHDLSAAGYDVERVGDCVAPRRAHAAVVEGQRAGGRAVSRRVGTDSVGRS